MNSAEVAAIKSSIEAQNAAAPKTVDLPDGTASQSGPGQSPTGAPAAPAPGPSTAPVPPTSPATEITVDGQTLTADQVRQMLNQLQATQQKEQQLAERERSLAETRRTLEGTVQELLGRPAGQPTLPPPPQPTPAPTAPATPGMDALESISARLARIEREAQIQGLKERHGNIDEHAVRAVLEQYPGVPPDTALALVVGTATLSKQSEAAGQAAAQRAGEAARTEGPSNTGVVVTQPIDVSNTPWEGLDALAVRGMKETGRGLLVRK